MRDIKLTLPVVHVVAENLARGWERAVLETWERGAVIATQYDKPGDPPSRDCALFLAVADPFAEPRIHRAMPGGFEDLEIYLREVISGVHDHWVDLDDPKKWQYTYHERFVNYTVPGISEPINQLDQVVEALAKAPHTRRAEMITWKPWLDPMIEVPPCMQYLWFRIFDDQLVLNFHIRSNDAYKAAFMNMYAITALQRVVAERVSERLGRRIKVGQYNHVVDSFHIYGSYFEEFKGFLRSVEGRSWEQRTYRTDDPKVQAWMADASRAIDEKLAHEKEVGR